MSDLSLKKTSVDSNIKDLYRKWQFSEKFEDPGDRSGKWQKVPDNVWQYLQFYDDGKIGGNYFTDAIGYKIKPKNTIAIISVNNKVESYFYSVDKQTLVISPGYPSFCKEGCWYKFVRVK